MRVEAFGGSGGEPFLCQIPPGHELVAFHGGTGGHVHRLGVYARPHAPAPAPEMGAGSEQAAAGPGCDATACATTVFASTTKSADEGAKTGGGAAGAGGHGGGLEEAKARAERLIRHFFVQLASGEGKMGPNEAAALAVKKASEWIAAHGAGGALPEGCA